MNREKSASQFAGEVDDLDAQFGRKQNPNTCMVFCIVDMQDYPPRRRRFEAD